MLACVRCNALKGPLDVEEFREGVAERLGLAAADLVFAGEAARDRPATRGVDTALEEQRNEKSRERI